METDEQDGDYHALEKLVDELVERSDQKTFQILHMIASIATADTVNLVER